MKKTITLMLAVFLAAFVSVPVLFAAGADDTASLAEKKPKKKKGEIKEVVFSVHLHCENCVKKVQENISFEKGVKDLHVCLADQIVAIKYDVSKTSEEVLKAAVEKLGYPVLGILEPGQEHGHGHSH